MPARRKVHGARAPRRRAIATTSTVAVTGGDGTILDLSHARARFTDSINRVKYRGERIVIQKHGRPVAALVSVEDLDLIRQLEDRIDLKDARRALAEAKGKFMPWRTVKRELGL